MSESVPGRLEWIEREIEGLRKEGLYHEARTIQSPSGPRMTVEGKSVLNLTTNDYLGFAHHPRLRAAASKAAQSWGAGPAAVRSIAGTLSLHLDLERKLAQFKRVEDSLFLQSGFVANQAAIPSLVGKGDVVFTDRLNHASIIDGCRLSGATIAIYEHADVEDAERKIREFLPSHRRGLLVTDGVFSMDGDIAPLPELVEVCERYGVMTMVDDAHGEGVLGEGGRGIVDHFRLHGRVDVEVSTFSKAFGVVGGALSGRRLVVEWIRQKARPYLFSSATTGADTAACLEALALLEESPGVVEKLWENARYFQRRLREEGFDIGKTSTPITPIVLGENPTAREFSRRLFDSGVFVVPITYPTVPKGTARIRCMVSASHSRVDLDEGVEAFLSVSRLMGLRT